MSKFCKVLSRDSQTTKPLSKEFTFEQLAYLIMELGKEYDDIESDFLGKSKFVVEQGIRVTEENEILCRLSDIMDVLKKNYDQVEVEIWENENILNEFSKIVENLEMQNSKTKYSPFTNEHAMLLGQVELLSAHISTTTLMINDIEAKLKDEGLLLEGNEEIIVAILNEHLEILLRTEENLQKMSFECEKVESMLQLIHQKLPYTLSNVN